MRLALASLSLVPACVIVDPGPAACRTGEAMVIDPGASISHAAGVDAGYYISYAPGGQWHIEWTCDTRLSALGCEFSGTITVDTPAGGAAASCYQCEATDTLAVRDLGATTELDFDTATTSGIDGVDVRGVPGHAITLDLQINGLVQNDLVFVPSLGATRSPRCAPLAVTPSAP